MSRRLVVAALAALFVLPAYANPTSGAGASRSTETGGSDKINREKSVSQDRSSGNKASRSRSRETSRESSRESKEGAAAKQEESSKRDLSVKLNVNPLLISEFIGEFESVSSAEPVSDMKSARAFFAACRPFSNIDVDFPVLAPGIYDVDRLQVPPANIVQIGGSRIAITNKGRAGAQWGGLKAVEKVLLPPSEKNMNGGTIAYYAACRISAHYFISQAAEHLLAVIEQRGLKIRGEEDMRKLTRHVYRFLADESNDGVRNFWGSIVVRSLDTWKQARCAPFLGYPSKILGGHTMDCGVFRTTGDAVYVAGVPTLSTDAIDGRRIEIALSRGDSDTRTASRESSRSTRDSSSSKTSDSSETYADSKRTAGMKASKASETTTSRKTGRDAKADVSAAPGQ